MTDERILIKKAEIKRAIEKLTKKELCKALGISYTFYLNSINENNKPSKKMIKRIKDYIDKPTDEVYRKVFMNRKTELTSFHESLEIQKKDILNSGEELMDKKVINEEALLFAKFELRNINL